MTIWNTTTTEGRQAHRVGDHDPLNADQSIRYRLLIGLVSRIQYRPGWTFELWNMLDGARGRGSSGGVIFVVTTHGYDAWHHENADYEVHMFFNVDEAIVENTEQGWTEWIFNHCIRWVEDHERAEFFVLNGRRPFQPIHNLGDGMIKTQ